MKLLYVEDDPGIREAYSALLERQGHTVTAVSTMEDAAVVFDLSEIDACITDGLFPRAVGLPPTDYGLHVAALCRHLGIPCVIHTGSDDLAETARKMRVEVRIKPAPVEELLAAVGIGEPVVLNGLLACPHCARRAPVHAAECGA